MLQSRLGLIRHSIALWLTVALIAGACGPTAEHRAGMPQGYTIPILDLSGQTQRQIVVDREPGQYLGHPTTVLLNDNRSILVVYPKGHGAGGIVMKRSADGGLTWSDRLPVPDNWATSKEVPTVYPVVDPAGVRFHLTEIRIGRDVERHVGRDAPAGGKAKLCFLLVLLQPA